MKYLSRNLLKTSVVKSDVTAQTTATAVGTDYVLISDTSDGGNLKKALASDLAGSGSGLTQDEVLAITFGGC